MGLSNLRKRVGKAAGAPIDRSSESKGLCEERSAISATSGPNWARIEGVRPSNTVAAAKFDRVDW